jgi:phenylpyruvate tautomerase PptA (4-oxalocrotonate tautomerase family)
MPLVTIKVLEDELSNSQARDLIHRVTEAVIPFVGEKQRDNT